MKLTFYGTCQTTAIASAIRKAMPQCEVKSYGFGRDAVPNDGLDCDAFIYQPTINHPEYRVAEILAALPARCRVVSIPYMYFLGYFPDHCCNGKLNAKTISATNRFGLFPYGHARLNEMAGMPLDEVVKAASLHNFLAVDYMASRLDYSQGILHEREAECSVRVANYIWQHYREERLFETVDHPTSAMFNHVLSQLCPMLNLPMVAMRRATQANDVIFPCVANAFEFKFPLECGYGNPYQAVDLREYLRAYFAALFPKEVAQ